MSFTENFLKELENKKKKLDNTEVKSPYSGGDDFTSNFLSALDRYKKKQNDDIAPVASDAWEKGLPKNSWQAMQVRLLREAGYTGEISSEEDLWNKLRAYESEREKKSNKSKKRSWFQSGAFSDGYQFGDITKTLLGTVGDAVSDIGGGILEMGESAFDAVTYGVGAIGGLFSEDFKDGAENLIKKDLYDGSKVMDAINPLNYASALIGGDLEGDSLLGDKTDSLMQSGGQLLGTVALQTVGVPWWVTSGVTSFGREVESAFQQGASYGEAGISGLVTAGAELLTEKLFGGSGLGERGLINTEVLTKGISRKGLKVLADFGIDVLTEGGEEVASQFFSTLGQQLTYEKEDTWAEILSDEEKALEYLRQVGNSLFGKKAREAYGDAFIGGAVLSGGMNAGKAVGSAKSGRDYRTGLTVNEEAVVSKEVENRIAEAEKDGKKLSNKDKAIIRDQALKDLEKGYISTDTIEEVLGGDTYKSYQDTVKSEETLQKEYDELGDLKESELTVKQRKRLNELEKLIEEAKTKSERDFLQKQYKSEVYELAKGSKLEESYNERARRGQAFTADVTKYKGKQRAIVQKAIDSGILNNTNKTHDFVDLVARIAGGKGVDFDFLNNAKLKESGFALDGVTVNGYFDASTKSVGINLNSAKALNTVVGHEITHVLEGTELYSELQKAVTEYAKTKGEYKSRYDALAELYKNIENADIDAELTADLVGDYLFTDADFVNNLSAKHRNVFQKIYDEVKYLCKIATAGSKEARQLEKVKKTFEDAFRAETKNTAQEGGVKYSIVALEDGKTYVEASRKVINGTTRDAQRKDISNFFSALLQNNSSIDIHTIEGDVLTITKADTAHKARDDYKSVNGQPIQMTDEEFAVKLNVEAHIDEVAEVSKKIGQEADSKNHSFAKDGFTYRRAYFKDFDGQYYEVTLSIGHNGTVATVYNVGKIKKGVSPSAKIIAVVGSKPLGKSPSSNSISQNSKKSTQNTKKSLSTENDDLGPIGDYNVYGKDVAIEGPLPDDFAPIGEDTSVTGFTGEYTGRHYNAKQSELLSALPVEALQNAADANGNLSFNVIGLGGDVAAQQAWKDAGLTYEEDGRVYVDENAVLDERDRRRKANSQTSVDSENGNVNRVDAEDATALSTKSTTALSTKSTTDNEALDSITDDKPIQTVKDKLEARLGNLNTELNNVREKQAERVESLDERIADLQAQYDGKSNKDTKTANKLLRNIERLKRIRADIVADYGKRVSDIESRINRVNDELQKDHSKADRLERAYAKIDRQLEQDKAELRAQYESRKAEAQKTLADKNGFIKNRANELYWELSNLKKGVRASKELGYLLDHNYDWSELKTALVNVKMHPDSTVRQDSAIESIVREALNNEYESRSYELNEIDAQYESDVAKLEAEADKERTAARKAEDLVRISEHQGKIVEDVKNKFNENGLDFDEVLKKAKDLSTFSTVDNTPQRVMEKSLGYKEGGILADLTVNKVAQNETEGIKWLNSITDRKNGLLAQLVKDYGIKPGSKASAAAQMYAEGFYVDKNGDIIQYGDSELVKDFPDSKVRENIKKLAKDERIRQFYDETLKAINESRVRNGYPEIQKLDNYFLHFRAMEDTFSRLGLPFNPNDIRAKDLPTDLNGVTADLKPGQPYFASAKHREGKRTSFDLLGGLEMYATSAKNQIYHIDDIQTLRALRNYIADTYGQAKGLENLDTLTEDEIQEKIKEVYGSHLSTFAKFLNEEANVLAGKTSLIDRGLEGVIGRRAITFMDSVNRQTGSNMVGYNLSSALTNLIAAVQAFAKTNKADFIKGFAQLVSNKVNSIRGKSDGFAEESPVCVRRKGSDRFYRTAWQKVSDPGYALMSAVDNFTTELIARAKYNELMRKNKNMDSETAHVETDKWVSRLMGDRSLGQQPQLYNSKMLGLVTKFQLEVRNQLDSQFYDTIQEAKASTEDIQNGLERNAKKAAKIGSTFFTLAVGQHLFGKAFESIAGYNPAFDIIGVLIKTLGLDDDEDSEDTVLDNIEQGFFELMGDMPYTSILEGGRIPISSALPIEELYKGTDQYGNEKSRWETLGEALPYYLMPGGYGQLKKTTQGLGMFDDDLPVSGSYTDSGNLRFPVEDTLWRRVQAALFGQYASENARDYFDNDRSPLKEKQIQEFIDSGISIQKYWEYREGLSGLKTLDEKADYIYGLDIPIEAKNLFINNLAARKEDIDLSGMEGFESFEEYDFAQNNPEKYQELIDSGVTVAEYEGSDYHTSREQDYASKYPQKYAFFKDYGISFSDYINGDDEYRDACSSAFRWAYNNPGKYAVSKAVAGDIEEYQQYSKELNAIESDKGKNGKTVSGSRKKNVIEYINDMDLEYGQKIILFRSQYKTDNRYNHDIVEYLNDRDDISYSEMVSILIELGFKVDGKKVYWD